MNKSNEEYIKDAIRFYWVGRYQEALEAFEQALKLAPDIVKIHEDMAKIYGKMAMEIFYLHKDYQKSRLLYKKAAELDKRFEAAYLQRKWQLLDRAYALFNRCPSQGLQEERNEANSAFQQVLLFDPTCEEAKQVLSKWKDIFEEIEPNAFNKASNWVPGSWGFGSRLSEE